MRPHVGLITVPVLLLAASLSLPALSGIPEPDAIVYGKILLNDRVVTAADTDVIVEARREGGEVVARYQMGSDPRAEDHYVLRIKLETRVPGADTISADAVEIGPNVAPTTLQIVVKDASGDLAQMAFTVEERGPVRLLNFGPSADFDGDGDVDLGDFVFFQGCFGGPGAEVTGECVAADLDGDGDADLADLIRFQTLFTGSL